MEFHLKKCQVLHITNKRHPVKNSYTIYGHKLEIVDQGKYFGVTIHKKLDWSNLIGNVTRKQTTPEHSSKEASTNAQEGPKSYATPPL